MAWFCWRSTTGASLNISFRHLAPPLIICYGYRSSHVPGSGHRPAKSVGRFAIVATGDIAVPDVNVAGGSCVELELDDVRLRVTVRQVGSVVWDPKERDTDKYRVWLVGLRLN